ncbi:hypothetical protein SASPL_107283 [Salvia splendens]|uniref:GATA-type domain-containing protein n=1 Tax=Salvia splendens TaxID=180675 RepID=A0A8X9A5K5_SALSN|nr:hypothetical protein SASPL_107283 [Salvia splendens]
MDKRNGNSHSKNDEFKEIDLTLKLGPSDYYIENQDEQNNDDMGNWNAPYNSSSSSSVVVGVAPSTYNYFAHKGSVPHNTITTSTHKRHMVDDDKACKVCGSQSTPLWRKGPDGPQTLCNACGLRHLRTVKKGAGDH